MIYVNNEPVIKFEDEISETVENEISDEVVL